MKKTNLIWGSSEEKKGWKGLNNAAIHTFNSNIINSFVREMFQNSIDARDKKLPLDPLTGKLPPLHIVISYKQINRDQFPDFEGFIEIFRKIKSAKPNEKHVEFFKNAEKSMGDKQSIKLFVYEDFNTTGLSGDDDDDNSTFSGCVLSEGISVQKGKTSGGSYGIGKNAIFGFSKLRTVFYASFNNQKEFIFQGIAKLASYIDKNGKKRSDRIFCGDGNDQKSLREFNKLLPEHQNVFARNKPGLSQFAVCPSEQVNWVEEFTKAILRNYWLLLDKGELIVELKVQDELKMKIEKINLEQLFQQYFNPDTFEVDYTVNPYGNPYEFYKCYKTGECVNADIKVIGKVRFYYSELQNNKTNTIAYLRNDMVVFTQDVHGFSSINYCGVFICDDDEGNSVLRDMEPPTHDSFSPERLDEKSEKYSSDDGKKILSGIKKIVRESLQKISDKYKKAAEEIPWLDEFFSSLTGTAGSGNGKRLNVESEKETPERLGTKIKAKVSFNSLSRNTTAYDPSGVVPNVGIKPIKPRPPIPPPPGPPPPPTPPGPAPSPKPKPGPNPGPKSARHSRIESRVFKTSMIRNIGGIDFYGYKMFLNSSQPIDNTNILISQKGDSGNVVFFQVADVIDSNGNVITFIPEENLKGETVAYKLRNIPIPSELTIFISEPYKSSIKIVQL